MKNYYCDTEHQVLLLKKIQGWEGVPYMHMGETAGGVDCTKLVGLILTEMGVISQIAKRVYYPKDWHINGSKEVVISSFSAHNKYARKGLELQTTQIPVNNNFIPMFGDIIGFSTNQKRLTNHVAIYIGSQIFHCLPSVGCIKSQYSAFWKKRVSCIFRIMEIEAWE